MENLPSIDSLLTCLAQISKTCPNRTLSTKEIEIEITKVLCIPEEALQIPREKSRTEFQYRLAWALTKAKQKQFIEHVGLKLWSFKSEFSEDKDNELV